MTNRVRDLRQPTAEETERLIAEARRMRGRAILDGVSGLMAFLRRRIALSASRDQHARRPGVEIMRVG